MDEITPKKLLNNSFFLTHFLSIKYSNTKENYEMMLVDALVYSISSHYLSTYNEAVLLNDNDEYLKRKYDKNESLKKITKLASYYQNYQQFFALPLFRNMTYGLLIQSHGDQKAEIFYKRTYSNKHEKKGNKNNHNENDDKIALNHSSDGVERNINEENKTIFDFVSRKTIEKFCDTSLDFITNQSNTKSESVLGNYNNENFFNTKRSNIEDSLICIVNYMNKKKTLAQNAKKKRTNKICKANVEKYGNNYHNSNNKFRKRQSLVKGDQIHKFISVEKSIKTVISPSNIIQERNKPLYHTQKEFVSVISQKISHSNSILTETSRRTPLSPFNTKHSKSKTAQHNSQNSNNHTSKNSFNCSNGLRTESNLSRNYQSKQSIMTHFLSNYRIASKNNSPQQKTSFGLYKQSINKQHQQTIKHKTSFNNSNNCTTRLANTTNNISDLLVSKRSHFKEQSNWGQSITHKDKKKAKEKNKSHHCHFKNTTRNLETPIFKNSLYTNYILNNRTSSAMLKENNRSNNRTHKGTLNGKINVNLTLKITSTINLKINSSHNDTIATTKLNRSYRNKTKSKSQNRCKNEEEKAAKLSIFSPYSTTNNRSNILSNRSGLLSNIRDMKNELKKKHLKQIANQKVINSNLQKMKRNDALKSKSSSNDKDFIHYSLLDVNNVQALIQVKNDRIIVNRMKELTSLKKKENDYNTKSDQDKDINREDSTWNK